MATKVEPISVAPEDAGGAALAKRAGWLHGPASDLLIMVAPWVLLLGALATSTEGVTAVWIAQFILGNTTHVILTFLMLATRRDVLRATSKQARLVVIGSLLSFGIAFGMLTLVTQRWPRWDRFPLAIVLIFGIQHRMAQARGIWSLYNLRSAKLGTPPPPSRERWFQRHWTSVGLLLVAISWLLVPSAPHKSFSLAEPIPLMEAPLPYETMYVLVGLWLVFAGAAVTHLVQQRARLAKLLHVSTHAAAITTAILFPMWGSVVWGSLHGLEYTFLCARMMKPREGDRESSFREAWVWPAIGLAILPLLAVGLFSAPFTTSLFGASALPAHVLNLTTALVIAHYFADAFIYRFRIPEVRRVALHRLGFS